MAMARADDRRRALFPDREAEVRPADEAVVRQARWNREVPRATGTARHSFTLDRCLYRARNCRAPAP
jgi:hypothetical protein